MILSGTLVAQELRSAFADRVKKLGFAPGLAVILVGENPASLTYIEQKRKSIAAIGGHFELHTFSIDCQESEVLDCIKALNVRSDIHGILVQSPLPSHWNYHDIVEEIAPEKDVDGFTKENIAQLYLGNTNGLLPCTPKGILYLLRAYAIDLVGKHVVIVGKSTIVGRPLGLLLLHEGATVTTCHSRTNDLCAITQQADIVITAVGKPEFFGREYFKEGAVVIDVGITRTPDGIRGDCNTKEIETYCSITPVPGGIGPMTVAMLLENTLLSAERSSSH